MDFDIKEILKIAMNNCNYLYNKEEGFRLDVVNAIKEKYKDSFVICEYATEETRESIDVVVFLDNKKYAIELKYRPLAQEYATVPTTKDEKYKITKAQKMYEFINDINKLDNLRAAKTKECFDGNFAVLFTNTKNFENKEKLFSKHYDEDKKKEVEIANKNIKVEYVYSNTFNGFYKDSDFYMVCIEK